MSYFEGLFSSFIQFYIIFFFKLCFRASKLLNELNHEAFRELRAGRKFPEMRAGDLVEVLQFPYITAKEPVKFRGILIAKSNNLAETRLRILSVSQVITSPLFP